MSNVSRQAEHCIDASDNMAFWGPVLLLLFCTGMAVAFGVHFLVAATLSFLVTFAWIAISLGGANRGDAFVMVAGFFAVPLAIGIAVAVALGSGLRRLLGRKSLIQVASKKLGAPPLAESCEQALAIAATHVRRGSRVRIRCPNCQESLVAKRVLSSSGSEPDIDVSCRCGGCSCVLPFKQSAV